MARKTDSQCLRPSAEATSNRSNVNRVVRLAVCARSASRADRPSLKRPVSDKSTPTRSSVTGNSLAMNFRWLLTLTPSAAFHCRKWMSSIFPTAKPAIMPLTCADASPTCSRRGGYQRHTNDQVARVSLPTQCSQVCRWSRSPCAPKMMMASTGSSMTPIQCGVQVQNSTASPGWMVKSRSPRIRRSRPDSTYIHSWPS
jgi:hypothetical protein